MRYIALDGLRGTCALIVALLHFVEFAGLPPGAFLEHSVVFVDFFFVLSGFVIAHSFWTDVDSPKAAGAFMLRRFGRLYPLHLVILVIWLGIECTRLVASWNGATAAQPFTGATSVNSLLSNLVLMQALHLHDGITWNYPSWSISVDFWTYLIFALVMVMVAHASHRVRIAAMAAVVVLSGATSIPLLMAGKVMTYDFGIVRCLYGFFSGVLAYQLFSRRQARGIVLTGALASGLEIAVVGAVLAYEILDDTGPLLFFAPFVFATATVIFAHEGGIVSRLLRSALFPRIGDWSYSIYMVHAIVLINGVARGAVLAVTWLKIPVDTSRGTDPGAILGALAGQGPAWAVGLALVFVAATLAASAVTYRLIEVPARTLANRWASRLHARRSRPATPANLTAPGTPSAMAQPTGH